MRNTFGNIFTLTTFGESHGAAVGGVIDGMPPGIVIDTDFIQSELDRRRPGQSKLTTSRSEADRVELLSGVFEGKSTTSPIGQNMVCATIVVADALRRVSPSADVWAERLPSWYCASVASA